MRTITKKFADRLDTQRQEADLIGLKKVSNHINNIVKNNDTRDTGSSYVYAKEDFQNDVEQNVWRGVVRIADYFDCNINAANIQNIVEKFSAELIDEIRIHGGISHGVGAYEPNVPGERLERVAIEIDEED